MTVEQISYLRISYKTIDNKSRSFNLFKMETINTHALRLKGVDFYKLITFFLVFTQLPVIFFFIIKHLSLNLIANLFFENLRCLF